MEPFPLNAMSDMVFHYIFSSEGSEPAILSFINAVQTSAGKPLATKVTIKNPFNLQRFIKDKQSIVDIKVTDTRKNTYEVEMQTLPEDGFEERILYYWARIYSEQLARRRKYSTLHPVISIVLTRFPLFQELPDLHNVFTISAEKNHKVLLTDQLEIHTLEFTPAKWAKLAKENSPLQWWLDFLVNVNKKSEEEMKTLAKKDRGIGIAYSKFRQFTADEDLRDRAMCKEIGRMDRIAQIDYAKKEGRAEGEIISVQQVLVQLLEKKFNTSLSEKVVQVIQAISDVKTLKSLINQVLTIHSIEELGLIQE